MEKYINPEPTVEDEFDDVGSKQASFAYPNEKDVYFSFIDILGFKDAFGTEEDEAEVAGKYREVFCHYFELISNSDILGKSNPSCYAGQTSDSLYFYTERIDFLVEYMRIYSYFCLYAMMKGVFLRGGIAKGKLYFNESHQFYGEGVIRAYLLESVVSKNPVVSLDSHTCEYLNKYLEADYEKFVYERGNRSFLLPFAYLSENFRLSISNEMSLMQLEKDKIREMIEMQKAKFEYEDRLFCKYIFLAEEFCKAFPEHK